MADQYYFAREGSQFGPFSAAAMREQAAAGLIGPADVVWREGTEGRVAAAFCPNCRKVRAVEILGGG